MSLRSQPVVIEIIGLDCSPKATALMIGCWRRDIWTSGSSEMGQGELMGSIRCTQIPFILVMISQSHLSPLSKPYSSNPHPDPKTHFGTDTVVLFSLSWFSRPPMLMNPCSMNSFFCHDHVLSHLCFTIMTFLLTVSPTLVPLLTHSLLLSIFLANWSMRSPALNF